MKVNAMALHVLVFVFAIFYYIIGGIHSSGFPMSLAASRKLLQSGVIQDPGTAQDCNAFLAGSSGTFSSPLSPYPTSTSCMYFLQSTSGTAINVSFSSFALEGGNPCNKDYVTILDPLHSSELALATYCGTSLPAPVMSSGNVMIILFLSDATTTMAGFQASYEEVCAAGKWSIAQGCPFSCHCLLGVACADDGTCPDQNNDGIIDCANGYSGTRCDVCIDSVFCISATTPAPCPSPVTTKICFPSHATVTTRHFGATTMEDIEIGDEVLVVGEFGELRYERIYAFSHADNMTRSDRYMDIRVKTSSDNIPVSELAISENHMVYIGNDIRYAKIVPASSVNVGDTLLYLIGDELIPVEVTEVNMNVEYSGLFSPHTRSGTILVNGGFLASQYTNLFSSHVGVTHALLWPMRMSDTYLADSNMNIINDDKTFSYLRLIITELGLCSDKSL